MNEITLIITLVIVVICVRLLITRLKRPLSNYARIISSICLLILVWFFGKESSVGPKLILSGLALTTFWREYFSLKKSQANK